MTIKEMWERVQEMFKQPTEFEVWIASRSPQSAADLDHLCKEWNYKQARNSF